MNQIINFKELKCEKSLNINQENLEHCLSFLITHLALKKPTLGHWTDRKSALPTWC